MNNTLLHNSQYRYGRFLNRLQPLPSRPNYDLLLRLHHRNSVWYEYRLRYHRIYQIREEVKFDFPDAICTPENYVTCEQAISDLPSLENELGADVLTYHQNQHYVAQKADEAGVYSIGYNAVAQGLSEKYLTAAVWDWNALYYQMIREYLQGKGNSVERHWFSLDTGVVALAECSELVDEETLQKIESAKQEMASGRQIFSGVIYDNNGILQCDEGESISDEILLEKMNWFVDGVVIHE